MMWSLTMVRVVVFIIMVTLMPNGVDSLHPRHNWQEDVGGGVGAVLEAVSQPTCCLILLTDGTISPSTILKEESVVRSRPRGMGIFKVAADRWNVNVTLALLSHLLHQARRVRLESWCVRVVVLSHDPVFLATFAEWSLKGRLLVWATKLLVVTRLPLPQLHALLSTHWTFSMMNTILLNLEDAPLNLRFRVLTYLPYSPEGARVVQVASWTAEYGLVLREGHSLLASKYSNFFGAKVNVTSLPFAPFWDEIKGPDNTTQYTGTDYMTLAAIADALNFTINVVPTTSWAEVTKLVEERVSFMSPVEHILLPSRLERFEFSWVYLFETLDFSMATPSIKPQWQSLYYPLSEAVWAAVLLALLLAPVVQLMIIRLAGGKIDVSVVALDFGAILLGQNLPRRLPKTSSSRMMVTTWLVFAFIIGSAYRGNLTASLILPKYPPRAETLEELVVAADRITMPSYGTEFINAFSRSNSKTLQRLAQMMYIVPSAEVGQRQATVKNQGHLDNGRFQQLLIAKLFTRADGTPKLYVGRDSVHPGQAAWPIPHDAPYKANIDRCLMAVVEAGLYEKWSDDLLFQAQLESRGRQQEAEEAEESESDSTFRALTITHLQGAFFLLFLGLGLDGLAFFVELITVGHE